MSETANDRDYERGVNDALRDDGLSNWVQQNNPIGEGGTYKKGYDWGVEHKHDGNHDDSGTGSDNSSSSGPCFISTVCVEAVGLPDDCWELQMLRKFRDLLLQVPGGRADIRLYDRIAPEIITSVHSLHGAGANQIWAQLYPTIRLAATLVLRGQYEPAYNLYRNVILRGLARRYLR